MRINYISLALLLTAIACSRHPCDKEGVLNELDLQSFPVEIENQHNTFQIGDTILYRIALDMDQYDSITASIISIDQQLSFRIETTTIAPLPSGPPFTIVNEFDQHFDMIVRTGHQAEPYLFDCHLLNGQWILELMLIPKRQGTYYSQFSVYDLQASYLPAPLCLARGDLQNKLSIHIETTDDRTHQIFQHSPTATYFDIFAFEVM